MTKEIIPMSIDNVDQCIDLYIKVFNAEPWNENWSHASTRAMLHDLSHTPGFKGYLLVFNHNIIGFMGGYSKTYGQGMTFNLAEFCIAEEFQGKGYGSRMLAYLEEELKKEDANGIFLLTSSGGMAEKFYKRSGFEIKPNRIVFNKTL